MKKIRKKLLRVHGSILIFIGVALTINSTIGTYLGIGIFSFLQKNEFALIGLFQAYLLMAVIGIVLWMGSTQENMRKWHLIGALAHIPPLTAIIMFWSHFVSMEVDSIVMFVAIFHCVLMGTESVFLIRKSKPMPDKTLRCVDCGNEFSFSEKDQEFYNQRGFQEPKRCKDCRDKRRRERGGSRGFGGR